MKRMTQKEFKDSCGSNCPVCRSNNTDTVNVLFLEVEMKCLDCGSEWTELHRMVGYELTKKGKEGSLIMPPNEREQRWERGEIILGGNLFVFKSNKTEEV